MDAFLWWRLWEYDRAADWYAAPYHWVNLVEGTAWLVFAGLVLCRWFRYRRSRIEWL